MYSNILKKMRAAARRGDIIVTPHAARAMRDDGLTLKDIVNVILTGYIVGDQQDGSEIKYILQGDACDGREVEIIAKLDFYERAVIITVYTI